MNDNFQKIQSVLLKKQNVIFAYVFGSRVKGYENLHSDWDIGIYLDPEEQKADSWERFIVEAELSSLLKSNVQIIILNNIDDPLLSFTIINEGIVILDRESAKRLYFESRVLNRYHDWQFFLNRHMKTSLKDFPKEEIFSSLKDFFKEHFLQYQIDMAFVYGSWASGYPHKDSDIDLAIVFSSEIQREDELFSLITDLTYKLREVLKSEINIIPIYRDFRKPMLYYNVVVTGIPVFIKENESFLDLKLEAISQMEDFSVFGVSWQLEIARRALRR